MRGWSYKFSLPVITWRVRAFMCEAILGHLACCNLVFCGPFLLFMAWIKQWSSRESFLYYDVFSSPWEHYFLRQELSVFTQFCLTPMQNFSFAVFSPTYKYFPAIYQLLTRNVSQRCPQRYLFLVSVFHLLSLCSPSGITFDFIFPTWPGLVFPPALAGSEALPHIEDYEYFCVTSSF